MKKSESKEYKLSGGSSVRLFESDANENISIALVKQKGRYPESGWNTNYVSTESLFVIKGKIEIHIESKLIELSENEVFHIEPNKKYFIEGEGEVLVAVTPASSKNKSEILD